MAILNFLQAHSVQVVLLLPVMALLVQVHNPELREAFVAEYNSEHRSRRD